MSNEEKNYWMCEVLVAQGCGTWSNDYVKVNGNIKEENLDREAPKQYMDEFCKGKSDQELIEAPVAHVGLLRYEWIGK